MCVCHVCNKLLTYLLTYFLANLINYVINYLLTYLLTYLLSYPSPITDHLLIGSYAHSLEMISSAVNS